MNGCPKGINQNSRKTWIPSNETLLFLKQIAKLKLQISEAVPHSNFVPDD